LFARFYHLDQFINHSTALEGAVNQKRLGTLKTWTMHLRAASIPALTKLFSHFKAALSRLLVYLVGQQILEAEMCVSYATRSGSHPRSLQNAIMAGSERR